MLQPRTLKILAAILAGYAVLALPGVLWQPYFDTPLGYLVIVPLFTAYLFHAGGIPGVLEHGGACGWGLCSPTALGWALVAAFWICIAWLAAWGVSRLTAR
jgi:hypothetical protein